MLYGTCIFHSYDSIKFSSLWAVVLVYGALFCSLALRSCLCAVIGSLCAVIQSYVPSFRSMGLPLVLCAIIPFYGPSSQSMDRQQHSMFHPPSLRHPH